MTPQQLISLSSNSQLTLALSIVVHLIEGQPMSLFQHISYWLVDDNKIAEGAIFKPSLLERLLKCPFTVFIDKSPHTQAETLSTELNNRVCLIEADGKLFHSPTGKRMSITIHDIVDSAPIAEHASPPVDVGVESPIKKMKIDGYVSTLVQELD